MTTLIIREEEIKYLIDKSTESRLISQETSLKLNSINTQNILQSFEEDAKLIYAGIPGPAGPVAGITEATEDLKFIGSGTGASKTTTGIIGDVIYESFGVGDEMYVTWLVPDDIERNYSQSLTAHMFSVTSEAGTFSSWEIGITTHNSDGSELTGTEYFLDAPMPDIAYEPTNGTLTLPAGNYVNALSIAMHIRIKRIASSNDPSGDIGIMTLFAGYTSDGRVGEQGADGAPGGEDEVALEKRTDFITDDELYRGDAQPGTADSAASWRIRKITISAVDGDVREMWADGNANYDKIWNNRLSYTYT